ncbi:virion structural protein [Cronobacter phage vB_CsaM_GAP32]|uniref:Uncharacterized protein n=1 Tax=Cronobacter phage vB_CsaM_GAP32 TaxID=1141136 RepID=K4F7F1_9CAUD|nr:virion structural protein [Cronobacter phage vB_CsaM_GAP32]AFC21657.1 hypothetical protein GAP32_207 [Cronobacter phage vB_CsaM_GAP32]
MKKQINEASVRIDVQGLESNDLETLSRMLALAGQAENKGPQMGGMTSVPAIAPLDLDSIGGEDETQPIMSPDMAPSADDMSGAGAEELVSAVSDLAGSVTDFGADSLDSGVEDGVSSFSVGDESDLDSGDMMGQEEDSNYTGDDDFDMSRMSSLAGIHESQDIDESDDVSDDSEDEADDEDQAVAESLLPDLSLDEDSVATEADAQKEFGPFRTEFECVQDGQQKTNGFEGDNFIVVPKGNAFYWKRTMQEEVQNEPNPEFYDDEGIRNSRHAYKGKQPGTALGDNPLVGESEDDEDESVDSIFESINKQYKKFMEGL